MPRFLYPFSTPAFAADTAAGSSPDAALTVVLVHGAWADGSCWEAVIPHLHRAGLHVVAVQNPLSSLEADVANVIRVIEDLPGQVLLVGHSYGGVVISEAGNHPKVTGLVYVAAFAPGAGQSINSLLSAAPEPPPWVGLLHTDAGGWVTWPAQAMADWFSTGLPAEVQAVLASTQQPTFFQVNDGAVGETPAWTRHPTTYVVAGEDRVIPPDLQRHFAQAMSARTSEAAGGHLVMLSHPEAVAQAVTSAVSRS